MSGVDFAAPASGAPTLDLEIDHFINEGFGWACKHCSAETKARVNREGARARFFDEGEAEEKEPRLSAPSLARWTSPTRRALACPRCGIEELVDKA